jgi:putative transcriptional regulator
MWVISMIVKSKIGKIINESPYKREYIRKHFDKSRNTISNWCTGKSYPTVPELFELAALLGVKVDDLYEENKKEEEK